MPACNPLFFTTMLYSNSQTSLYSIVGCLWEHVISATWIPGSITFHHAPIQYNTIRTQHDVPGMQPKLKMNYQKQRWKSLEWRKITIVGFKGLTHPISYNARTTTCTVLASAAQANTTPMQKPNSVTGQACLSSTVLTVYNILLPAGVISRIALQSLCHRYSDRNVSLSTLKLPSFRALVLLYCCLLYTSPSPRD